MPFKKDVNKVLLALMLIHLFVAIVGLVYFDYKLKKLKNSGSSNPTSLDVGRIEPSS